MAVQGEQLPPFAFNPAWRRPASRAGQVSGIEPTQQPAAATAPEPQPTIVEAVEELAAPPPAPARANHHDIALEMTLARAIAAQVAPTLSDEPPGDAEPAPEMVAPAKVSPPRPEPVTEPVPFKPDPSPQAEEPWRPVLGERLIPYLAALVGLVALGATIYLDLQNQERFARLTGELAQIRTTLEEVAAASAAVQLPPPVPAPAPLSNDGTIDALLALQERVAAIETAVAEAAKAPAPAPAPLEPTVGTMTQTVLQDGPTEDCIPVGTRFVALTGEPYPICRTPEVITLSEITGDGVTIKGGEAVVEGGFSRLSFGTCTMMVLSADIEGFAELRVACT